MPDFNLDHFIQAQEEDYPRALAELQNGRKASHWMWYIFPQFDGLGFSSMSKKYSIKSLDEARAYLNHPLLGPRLVECVETLLQLHNLSAHDIFGTPDDMKLCSSATLFAAATPAGSVFEQLLTKYFTGLRDSKTLQLLQLQ